MCIIREIQTLVHDEQRIGRTGEAYPCAIGNICASVEGSELSAVVGKVLCYELSRCRKGGSEAEQEDESFEYLRTHLVTPSL